jgi:hypothetical protein
MTSDGQVTSLPIQVDDVPEGLAPIDTTLVYSPYLSANLRKRAEQFRTKAGVCLLDELALMRATAVEAVETYSEAVESAKRPGTTAMQKLAIIGAAHGVLVSAINQVRDMAIAAHKVMTKESLDPGAVQSIIFQVVKVFDNELQLEQPRLALAGIDPRALVERVSRGIDMTVNAGVTEHLSTTLTAETLHSDVVEMLDSVPSMPGGAAG